MTGTWADITADPEFSALPLAEKEGLRRQFFERSIAPEIDTPEIAPTWQAFQEQTQESMVEPEQPSMFDSLGQTLKDAFGTEPEPEADSGYDGLGQTLLNAFLPESRFDKMMKQREIEEVATPELAQQVYDKALELHPPGNPGMFDPGEKPLVRRVLDNLFGNPDAVPAGGDPDALIEFHANQQGMTGKQFKEQVGPKTGVLERAGKDFASGAVSTGSGLLGFASRVTGGQGLKAGQAKLDQKAYELLPSDPNFLDKVASGFGSTATFFIPGMGIAKGAQALSSVSKTMGLWLGSGAAAGMEAAVEAGSVYSEMLREGKTEEEAKAAADQTFFANAGLLALTNRYGLFGDKGSAAMRRTLAAAMEGSQEGAQQVVSNVATDKPATEGVGESAAIGALVGGGLGGNVKTDQERAGELLQRQVDGAEFDPAQIERQVVESLNPAEGQTQPRVQAGPSAEGLEVANGDNPATVDTATLPEQEGQGTEKRPVVDHDIHKNLPKHTVVGGADQIKSLVHEVSSNNAQPQMRVRYAVVMPEQADRLQQATGLDLDGYKHTVDVSGIRHAMNQHGNQKAEESRGQIAVTEEDFARIPDIVSNYDHVELAGQDRQGNNLIKYRKDYGDTTYYVEEVRRKRKELVIKTLWKTHTREQMLDSEESPPLSRPERFGGNPPELGNSIAPSPEESKTPAQPAQAETVPAEPVTTFRQYVEQQGHSWPVSPKDIGVEQYNQLRTDFQKQRPADLVKPGKGKSLREIYVHTSAEVEGTGEVVRISERADQALKRIDGQIETLQKLKECIAS